VTVIAAPWVLRRVPGTIVAMFGVSIAAVVMGLPVETIGTRFGGVPSGLPPFRFPAIQWGVLPDLLVPAMTVAMLGAIESLLSATVADRMMGTRHNPNVELIGQGSPTSFRPWSADCRRLARSREPRRTSGRVRRRPWPG
jgi:SulP family sulfate permease